jgi:hypothetical protein
MGKPLAVIIRFRGDSAELLERFERVRHRWIDSQEGDYERPLFYAACTTDDGIAVVTGWETAIGHRAFGQGLHRHIEAAGMSMPDSIERMQIENVDWP